MSPRRETLPISDFALKEVRRHLSRLAEHHNMTGIASATSAVKIGYVTGKRQPSHCYRTHRPLVIAERFGTLETATQEREPAATLADPDLNGLRHGTVARQN
jgi:hypothetical protein